MTGFISLLPHPWGKRPCYSSEEGWGWNSNTFWSLCRRANPIHLLGIELRFLSCPVRVLVSVPSDTVTQWHIPDPAITTTTITTITITQAQRRNKNNKCVSKHPASRSSIASSANLNTSRVMESSAVPQSELIGFWSSTSPETATNIHQVNFGTWG